MAGSQFVHISTFGLRARSGAGYHSTIRGTNAEAMRAPGASPHVANPMPPNLLYGVLPVALTDEAEAMARKAREVGGERALRSDGGVQAVLVASYHVPRAAVQASPTETARYTRWRTATVNWLLHEFDALSIVEHVDEKFLHLHCISLPHVRLNGELDFARCHPGLHAKRVSWHHGEKTTTQDARYRKAMVGMQDDFYDAVSQHFGHARTGPKRERSNRRDAVRRQKAETERLAIEAEKEAFRQERVAYEMMAKRRDDALARTSTFKVLAELTQAVTEKLALQRLYDETRSELYMLRQQMGFSHDEV